MPHINAAGLALVKQFEGCSLTAYPDPGSGGEPYTIGYGHTGDVTPGQTISQAQADELLASDLVRFEEGVDNLIWRNLTPNQFSALVSFAYNVGLGALAGSTLLHDVNAGDFGSAATEFGHWVYASGNEMAGLVRRRAAEATLFSTPEP